MLIAQAEEGLMNQCGRLQSVVTPFAPQVTGREIAQILIHRRKRFIDGARARRSGQQRLDRSRQLFLERDGTEGHSRGFYCTGRFGVERTACINLALSSSESSEKGKSTV